MNYQRPDKIKSEFKRLVLLPVLTTQLRIKKRIYLRIIIHIIIRR